MTTASKQVAATILNQLGGNRFVVMTGSKNFIYTENSLQMELTRNQLGAKFLIITLTSMDDYNLEFVKIKTTYEKIGTMKFPAKTERITLKTFEGVYCDQLRGIFERETGLYTSL